MLIGKTVSLKELEEHMIEELAKTEREASEEIREINRVQNEQDNTKVYVLDEEGEKVYNPEHKKMVDEFNRLQESIRFNENKIAFIKEKLHEIEEFEKSQPAHASIKENERITLSLKDCILLNIESEDQ